MTESAGNINNTSTSTTTPLKFNPHKCTAKRTTTMGSPYATSTETAPRAGLSYEDVHRSEQRLLRHPVPHTDHAATPKSSHKKLFVEEKNRMTVDSPPRVKPIHDSIFRSSADLFGATTAASSSLQSTSSSGPTLAASTTRPDSSGGRIGVNRGCISTYQDAIQRRISREGNRLGIGHPGLTPEQKSYKVETPYARDD